MMVHAGAKGVDAIFVMATPFEAAGVVLLGRFKIQVAALGLRNLMSAWPAPRFAANNGSYHYWSRRSPNAEAHRGRGGRLDQEWGLG